MGALFEYSQYMPHGMCLLWEPWLVLLWAGSDLLIFLAYMAIPLALFTVLKRRPDVRNRGLVALFAGFILLCGITHAMSIVTLWYAIYPAMGAVKLATGVVSIATAIVLFRLIPALVRIPTPDIHQRVIAKLESTLADLSAARDELEDRVRQRTAELDEANLRLSFTARDAVQRSRNLIQSVSSLTQPGVDAGNRPDDFLRKLRGRINALAMATSTVMEQSDSYSSDLERVIRRQIDPLFTNPASRLLIEGDKFDVDAQGAQQISLVAWELASRLVNSGASAAELPQVSVRWYLAQGDGGDERVHVIWREVYGLPQKDEVIYGTAQEDSTPNNPIKPLKLSEFAQALLTQIVPRLLHGEGQLQTEGAVLTYELECSPDALNIGRAADKNIMRK